jgi:hypothetical protein
LAVFRVARECAGVITAVPVVPEDLYFQISVADETYSR